MAFWKKKTKKIELIKTEIEYLWKIFIVINGVFIVCLSRSFRLTEDPTFWESLILITSIIYWWTAILISGGIIKKYNELFRLLENKKNV
jgi:hypothetical protein